MLNCHSTKMNIIVRERAMREQKLQNTFLNSNNFFQNKKGRFEIVTITWGSDQRFSEMTFIQSFKIKIHLLLDKEIFITYFFNEKRCGMMNTIPSISPLSRTFKTVHTINVHLSLILIYAFSITM